MSTKKINYHVDINSLEEDAKLQFESCCGEDFVLEAALMPDAHTGYVAPIGAVIKTKGAVVPSWVGYDIGCGMIAVQISDKQAEQDLIKANAQEIFDEVNRIIPMGAGGHNPPPKKKAPFYSAYNSTYNSAHPIGDGLSLNALSLSDPSHRTYFGPMPDDVSEDAIEEVTIDMDILDYMKRQLDLHILILRENVQYTVFLDNVNDMSPKNLGTLGSGNHFIEILEYENETWLVIHSGSRGVGHYVATYFMKLVSGKEKGFEATYAIRDKELKNEYMAYQNYCLEFALLNRMTMAYKVAEAIKKITGIEYSTEEQLWVNKNHNHCIEIEEGVYLHRKGATSSEKDERGVIPANMRDGCFLVKGLGNAEFLNSSSHGAGRRMSRAKAKSNISLEHFKDQMQGIVAPVTLKTLDESPDAYKDIIGVMELQKDSVEVIKHLKPFINWKG